VTTTVRSLAPDLPIIEMSNVGHFTLEDARRATREGVPLSRADGVWNVLMDMRETTHTPTAAELITFISDLAKYPVPDVLRQAIVRPTDVNAAMWADLYAAAAMNRGQLTKVFRTRESAIAWLLADESGQRASP
jgi:hypothetical protein